MIESFKHLDAFKEVQCWGHCYQACTENVLFEDTFRLRLFISIESTLCNFIQFKLKMAI